MFIYKSLLQKSSTANYKHRANSTQQCNQENPGPGESEHWREDGGSVQNVSDAVLHTASSAQKIELIRKYTIPEIKTNKLFRTN